MVVASVVDVVAVGDRSRQVADDSVDGVVGQVVARGHAVVSRSTADEVFRPVAEELG